MIDSGGINRINSPDLYNQLKKTQNQQKKEKQVGEDAPLFRTENLEKSGDIKLLLDEVGKIPERRAQLVEHFQELIKNDAYQPDPEMILRKIMDI